jgi:flagella basal body P-ring formation protein FlgA
LPAITAAMFVVLTCYAIAAANLTATSYTVCLRTQALVKSTTLVLADIADLSGEDEALVTKLARMPLGSVTDVRLLRRSEVLSLIRSFFPGLGNVSLTGAEFTRVSMATRTPDAAEIAAVLKAHLAAVSSWREDEIEIRSIDNLKAVELPLGDIRMRVVSRGTPSDYRKMLVLVEAVLDGKPLRTFWIKADVRVHAQVAQMAKPVPYGRALQADDLHRVLCEIEDPRADYIRDCAEAVGMTAKRSLAPGDLLSRRWVAEVRLVRSGEIVRLLAQYGSISISVLARALQDGKLGDRIKVRNVDSDRALTVVVVGRGEVRLSH